MASKSPPLLLAAALLATGASCAEGSAQFTVKSEAELPRGGTTISIFGVFRDGRMSPEYWSQIGPALSASLGQRSCEVAYGEKLQSRNPQLFSTVDDYAKSNGVTEELLEQFATTAGGELIMSLSISGRPESEVTGPENITPPGMPNAQPSRRGAAGGNAIGGGAPRGQYQHRSGKISEEAGFGISASLFSVRLHRSVLRVNMTYYGPSVEDAISRFVSKLEETVPGAACRGWNWSDRPLPAKVDPEPAR